MKDRKAAYRYVIISPMRDEEKYVETTIKAVLKQTISPVRWVIVDDASEDKSTAVVKRYAETIPWITVMRREWRAERQPGSIMQAFAEGYALVQDVDCDFIVKLDCDVELPADYFERLMGRFEQEGKLGIASGVYLEDKGRGWSAVRMPEYHAAGASKMLRKECFVGIGGFVSARGWDTVDEIRAQMNGWKTRHFEELQFLHLRNEGNALGSLRTNYLHGEVFYLTGGGNSFFLLKVLHRFLFGKPFFLGGLVLLLGFLRSWLLRRPRVVDPVEAGFYRKLLNRRIVEGLQQRFASLLVKSKAWSHT